MGTVQHAIEDNHKPFYYKNNNVVIFWSLANLLTVMNTTMFNVALPAVLVEFDLSSSTASWLVSGYSVMLAIATLTFSRLSDFVPLKRLVSIGIIILTVASLVGFFSPNFYLLLTARIVQSMGAGALFGLGMVLAGRYIPIERRGKAMAFIYSASALAFGLGPLLGGLITDFLGWRYLFIVPALTLLFIPLFLYLLPKEKIKPGVFDYGGAIITSVAVTLLLLFINTFSIPVIVFAIFLFVMLWLYLQRHKAPFIPTEMLRNRQYLKLTFIGHMALFINFANLFLMPLLLASVYNLSPIYIGLIIFPGAIFAVVAGQFIGRSIDRFGTAPVLIFGHITLISGSLLLAFFSAKAPIFVLFFYFFMSVGFTAITSSNSNEVTRILPVEQIGSGIGILQLIQFFGGSIGVAITGLLLTVLNHFDDVALYRTIYLVFACVTTAALFMLFIYLFARKKLNVNQQA